MKVFARFRGQFPKKKSYGVLRIPPLKSESVLIRGGILINPGILRWNTPDMQVLTASAHTDRICKF